ncbi:uncharacterized protein HGUI_01822 [Hanseniaspora guilliermondii]|uniref:Uncharacterized protein n=1 Tax=Hanseniaspora guilliermondii TaxID=56406 RepID=A0A1L0FJ51_9ASCO|nr:uncharacterized protein HGUI_01822 [Hanseniaspora guilliermondii]
MMKETSKEDLKSLAEYKEVITEIQIDYKNNLRQHLYSILVLRKVLDCNKNDKVTFPKRLSFWPRKQTAEYLKKKLRFDYVDEYEDYNSIVDIQHVKKRKKNSEIADEEELDVEEFFKHEVYSAFQRKLLEKAINKATSEEEVDAITQRFLSSMEYDINKNKNEITDNIVITFDDVIRGINYTKRPSNKRAISYKDVLNNCDIIYDDIDNPLRFETLKNNTESLFSMNKIAENCVDDKFKLHGEIIVSDLELDSDEYSNADNS